MPVPGDAGTETTAPVESKWVDTGWRSEARVIEGKYNAGVLATKSVLDLDHPTWAVPAPLVALLLGEQLPYWSPIGIGRWVVPGSGSRRRFRA